MKTLNLGPFKSALLQLRPRGGTDMEKGIKGGTQLFDSVSGQAQGKQNRIMFLTDAKVALYFKS